MSTSLTTHERMRRMFAHQDADRVPIRDSPWGTTLARWHREGLPAGTPWTAYFDTDRFAGIGTDNSPRYEMRTLEETEEYRIHTSAWGTTMKSWKKMNSTPEFLDFRIRDRATWAAAKARMTPDADRIDWERLRTQYRGWREQGCWITCGLWFGFDITHSWNVGTEAVLIALAEDPEWCVDMFNTELDLSLALAEQVWQAGYTFDAVEWPDDLGYKGTTFFSVEMYRELLKPIHGRAIAWAHRHGIKACMHSCGDIRTFIPEFIDNGLDGLNPLEVKAGVDPVEIKQRYGDRLLLHGGMNAAIWDKPGAMEQEVRSKLPHLMRDGGYVWGTDHSIPDTVSLQDFGRIVALVKELGRY